MWDETLLELHDKLDDCSPPPRGTIILFWRDDGISWQSISDVILYMWDSENRSRKQQQENDRNNNNNNNNQNNKTNTSQNSDTTNNKIVMTIMMSPSDYYPLIFAGKSRMYFDYAQFSGGAAGNKFWPLNTFGSWIPHSASTLERVFLVPELFPPQFMSSCSPIYQQEKEKQLMSSSSSSSSRKQSSSSRSSSNIILQRMFTYFSSNLLPGFKLIGVQGNLWSELLVKDEILRYQLFPRMFGVAEVGWSLCLSGVVPTVRMHAMKMRNEADYRQMANRQNGKTNALMNNRYQPAGPNYLNNPRHHEEELERQRIEIQRHMIENAIANNARRNPDAAGEREHEHSHHFSCAMNHWMPSLRMRREHQKRIDHDNNNEHFGARNKKDAADDDYDDAISRVYESDLWPVPEARCHSFDIASRPIMTSCFKEKVVGGAYHEGAPPPPPTTPVFFTIWEQKMICSAQNEESS